MVYSLHTHEETYLGPGVSSVLEEKQLNIGQQREVERESE